MKTTHCMHSHQSHQHNQANHYKKVLYQYNLHYRTQVYPFHKLVHQLRVMVLQVVVLIDKYRVKLVQLHTVTPKT